MIKKIALITSFTLLLFFQSSTINSCLFAATGDDSSTTDTQSSFLTIWESIKNWLLTILQPNNSDSVKDFNASTLNTNQELTTYSESDKDFTHRVLPQANRERQIGIWFYDALTRPTDYPPDQIVSKKEDSKKYDTSCPDEIKLSDLIYFFYTKNEKKIYDHNSLLPLEYTDDLKNLINGYKTNLGPDSCYRNTYSNISSVPNGLFQGQGEAALTSTQINELFRHITVQSLQASNSGETNNTPQETERLTENTIKQEEHARVNYLPQNIKDQVNCSANLSEQEIMDNIRKIFKKTIMPQNWQGTTKTEETNNYEEYDEGSDPGNCSPGPGMSQYGAQGMALSGKTYKEILTAYYGIGTNGMDLGEVKSNEDKITVKLYNDNNNCDELVNEDPNRFEFGSKYEGYRTLVLTVEDYLLCLAEIG
jgi:hypothetical protein